MSLSLVPVRVRVMPPPVGLEVVLLLTQLWLLQKKIRGRGRREKLPDSSRPHREIVAELGVSAPGWGVKDKILLFPPSLEFPGRWE